jgi:hypothetical protein
MRSLYSCVSKLWVSIEETSMIFLKIERNVNELTKFHDNFHNERCSFGHYSAQGVNWKERQIVEIYIILRLILYLLMLRDLTFIDILRQWIWVFIDVIVLSVMYRRNRLIIQQMSSLVGLSSLWKRKKLLLTNKFHESIILIILITENNKSK